MRQTNLAVLSLLVASTLLSGCGGDIVLLNSAGPVAAGLSNLMMIAIYTMLLVVIPSIIMAIWFGWQYRKSNKNADYRPNWSHSTAIEIVVWGVPILIISYLAYLAWTGSHAYDPYRSRAQANEKELTIQVIAEQFKWIFIYPEQNIATVNEVRFPERTPIAFRITSNFTVNSFFIPKLAGQIYAMAGMQTQLHLSADQPGVYRGFSSNYSGYGFSQMHFLAHSVPAAEFTNWVQMIKNGQGNTVKVDDKGTLAIQKGMLDQTEFKSLRDGNRSKHQIEGILHEAQASGDEKAIAAAKAMKSYPVKPHPVTYYSSVTPNLFVDLINSYMGNYHGGAKANPEYNVGNTIKQQAESEKAKEVSENSGSGWKPFPNSNGE